MSQVTKTSFPKHFASRKERLETRKSYLKFLKEYIHHCPKDSCESIRKMIKMMKRLVKELQS